MQHVTSGYASFLCAFKAARDSSARIREACSLPCELPYEADWYLAPDMLSGFGIDASGQLVAVFSRVKGRGAVLLADAVWRGAQWLTCFDGYLRNLYEAHGFYVASSVAHWHAGGPEVLTMRLLDADTLVSVNA